MKFVFGELFGIGMIGFTWTGTLGAIGSFLVSAIIVIFAVIGLVTVIKLLLFGRKKSKYKYFKD